MWLEVVAEICLAWYIFIALVCAIGYIQLFRKYSTKPKASVSSKVPNADVPHVTIVRPCKGIEPYLYECLAATFHQDYPSERLTVHFCISSREDAAYPVIKKVLADYSILDARLFVEDEDPALQDNAGNGGMLGPNPKIRNMSRAYREARGDVVWILDCNVWVGNDVCGRMVDKLFGLAETGSARPYKFAHHLPISVDVSKPAPKSEQLLAQQVEVPRANSLQTQLPQATASSLLKHAGGRLEEVFLSSSHAKMYVAINSVAVAPCICGKSSMFRRSHLNYLTSTPRTQNLVTEDPGTSELEVSHSVGIDYFSNNICEDHLIGDLLWRSNIPDEPDIGNHGLIFGDLVIQPTADMSLINYVARRVRWLRVRKFTVTLATLVEPGTESFLCSAYGAFAVTSLTWFNDHIGIPQTWPAFLLLWLLSISIWAAVDWTVYLLLQSGRTIEVSPPNSQINVSIPKFAQPLSRPSRRPFQHWLLAWLGREALALPIWAWAFYGGVTVEWRGKKFWVGLDMRVHEVKGKKEDQGMKTAANGHIGAAGKARID